MTAEKKKAGFAVLVGRSNVGKSTLLNNLVGTKVAITSPKPQTTRKSVHGILHDPRGQIVFVDTPGIFERARDTLTASLNREAKAALEGIDVILYVVDPTRAIGNEEHMVRRMIDGIKVPQILVINKIDLNGAPYLEQYRALGADFDAVAEISARKAKNLVPLVDTIFDLLPEGVPFYPEYQFSNMEHKTWLSEHIREKIFIQMHSEIPFSVHVEIEEEEERETGILYIKARIFTTAPQYKKMIIGTGGRKIKEIGSAARKELQQILNKKIYLDLEVEVDSRWKDRVH